MGLTATMAEYTLEQVERGEAMELLNNLPYKKGNVFGNIQVNLQKENIILMNIL